MNIYQLLAGCFITFIVFFRSMTVKIGTKNYSSKQITFANYFYMMVALCCTMPFMTDMFISIDASKITPIIAALIKGIMLYASVKLIADIAKESNSSAVFAGYISLGIGSLLNYFILSENLTMLQIVACVSLGILGMVFFLRGPASELSKFGKKAFVLLTLIIILNMFVDGVGIRGLNWYMYSIISSGFSLLIAFIILLFEKKYVYLKELNSPILIVIGLVFAIGEFVILYSMQNYLPVSIAFLFLRLSAPIVMFVSAYIYKERTPKEQLLFGGLAVLFALPILFK